MTHCTDKCTDLFLAAVSISLRATRNSVTVQLRLLNSRFKKLLMAEWSSLSDIEDLKYAHCFKRHRMAMTVLLGKVQIALKCSSIYSSILKHSCTNQVKLARGNRTLQIESSLATTQTTCHSWHTAPGTYRWVWSRKWYRYLTKSGTLEDSEQDGCYRDPKPGVALSWAARSWNRLDLELNVVMSDLINLVESFSSASRIRTYSEYCRSTDIVCSTYYTPYPLIVVWTTSNISPYLAFPD